MVEVQRGTRGCVAGVGDGEPLLARQVLRQRGDRGLRQVEGRGGHLETRVEREHGEVALEIEEEQ